MLLCAGGDISDNDVGGDARHEHLRTLLRIDDTGLAGAQQTSVQPSCHDTSVAEQLRQARHRPKPVASNSESASAAGQHLRPTPSATSTLCHIPLFSNAAVSGSAEAMRLAESKEGSWWCHPTSRYIWKCAANNMHVCVTKRTASHGMHFHGSMEACGSLRTCCLSMMPK